MEKEVVVHIYNAILLSHKKEGIWLSSNEANEPRACYTEWSESEKQILFTYTYMWNLEKCYTEWSESEREEQILFIYTYMWNLEKCYTEWSESEREKQILFIYTYMWNLEK